MRLFNCQHCGQIVYFENTRCERCGHRLGFATEDMTIHALEAEEPGPAGGADGAWRTVAEPRRVHRFCANAAHEACNWLVPAGSGDAYCAACRHNGVVPDVSNADHLHAWQQIEFAKHRLFYALLKLRLPLRTRAEDPDHGLVFEFLADSPSPDGPKVMTGHDNGLVTIALVEADNVERERRRQSMGEPYRTLLGHFRHEVGHHFWDILVRDRGGLEGSRAVFGDDAEDYGAALKRHYEEGVPPDWQQRYVSAYATTHAWEDFAETWAHYLHIVDATEMAAAFGIATAPALDEGGALTARMDVDPYEVADIHPIVDRWLPLAAALNNLNRCMGQPDLYPFVLSPPVIEKLGYVHGLVHGLVHDRRN